MNRLLALFFLVLVSATSLAGDDFPESWFWGDEKVRAMHQAMVGKKAPTLRLADINGKTVRTPPMLGKVVVVDFWATWCGPCLKAIPEMVELQAEYKDQGLLVIGIHDSRRGVDRMAKVAGEKKINYPLYVDDNEQSAKNWKVRFWPTIAVLDRTGKIRAIGLQPSHVKTVVETLLKEPAPSESRKTADITSPPPVPAELLESGTDVTRSRRLASINATTPPELDVSNWINGEMTPEDLKGKIVVLDFWATWCGPCIASIPKNNALAQKYGDDVVLIGVCHDRGAERMAEMVKSRNIRYPVCHDVGNTTINAYMVNGYPDYYVFDRQGRLRVPDCRNSKVEAAIKFLMAEEN